MTLGGWAITQQCFDWILDNVPSGSKVLEFGSGMGTGELVKHFDMTSIEQDAKWVDKYNSRYIYSPLQSNNWYNWADLEKGGINDDYALILIDGPFNPKRQDNARQGIQDYYLAHPTLFENCFLVFDDTNREKDRLICDWFISQGFYYFNDLHLTKLI